MNTIPESADSLFKCFLSFYRFPKLQTKAMDYSHSMLIFQLIKQERKLKPFH